MAQARWLIESGAIFWVMLAVVALETGWVLGLWWRRRRGVPPQPFLLNMGAGGSLMVAVWVAFADLAWYWLAAVLLLALAFHLADLAARWR